MEYNLSRYICTHESFRNEFKYKLIRLLAAVINMNYNMNHFSNKLPSSLQSCKIDNELSIRLITFYK